MKVTFIFILLLAACSSGKNELMTSLLNRKKAMEDSAKDAHNYESYYMQKAKESIDSGADSMIWKALVDSSILFFGKGRSYEAQAKAADFSIDSLSKMR